MINTNHASHDNPKTIAYATMSHYEHVCAALGALGLKSTIEYPMFIAVDGGPGALWSFGTANGTWGGDFSRDGEVIGSFETDAKKFDEPSEVARQLFAGYMAANYEE